MTSFLSDFNIFFNSIYNMITTFFAWMISTVLGEIILFDIIISLFITVVYLIINMKN